MMRRVGGYGLAWTPRYLARTSPLTLRAYPSEEINQTDAARRTSLDPDEQPNHPDQPHAEDALTIDEDADSTD